MLNLGKNRFYRRHLNDVQSIKDLASLKLIKPHFIANKHKVGIRQLKMLIDKRAKTPINKKRIARIKKKFLLFTQIRKKNKFSYFAMKNHEHKTCPNLLNRSFKILMPDRVYSTDITQLNYGAKKAYLAVFKDLCTKEIVAKNISSRIDINLTNKALSKALVKIPKERRKHLMIHSDQGFHFTHISYRQKLELNGVTQSMSRRGNCLDNAPVESFFGCLKDHLELRGCDSIEDVKKEVTKAVNFYNNHRPQLGLKKMPPSKYRRHLCF